GHLLHHLQSLGRIPIAHRMPPVTGPGGGLDGARFEMGGSGRTRLGGPGSRGRNGTGTTVGGDLTGGLPWPLPCDGRRFRSRARPAAAAAIATPRRISLRSTRPPAFTCGGTRP